ncbi:MAG: proton-conducting transporter membrane subunit [Chloroflexota bacterium]|nr:proton-conducting transporter membrane subunit [Chloroflexota bacterium]
MSGVVLLYTFLVLAAILVYLLRRWPTPSAALAGLSALALGVMLWTWPNDQEVFFLGRVINLNQPVLFFGQHLEMGPTGQWTIGFMAVALAATYVGAWRVSQGRTFFPFGLLLLALLSTVLLIRPLWLAPAILAAVLSMATFVIQAGRRGSTRGAARIMWLPVLAIPLFLLAAWYLKQVPLNPDDPLPLQSAARLASWGLLLLLAPWPLHGPGLSLGAEAPPLVAAWLSTALLIISVSLLQGFLLRYQWLQNTALFYGPSGLRLPELLLYGGLALTLWAGMAAMTQRDLSRVWSYSALYNHGSVLIALGLGARSSWGLVWLLLITRTVSLLVSGFGLAVIRDRAGGLTDYGSIRGFGTRTPWSSTALLLGGLSLAGLPLTMGFASQWTLSQTLGTQDWLLAALLLTGAIALSLGLLRGERSLLGHLENRLLEREDSLMVILAAAGIGVIVISALWPVLWQNLLITAEAVFTLAPPP